MDFWTVKVFHVALSKSWKYFDVVSLKLKCDVSNVDTFPNMMVSDYCASVSVRDFASNPIDYHNAKSMQA